MKADYEFFDHTADVGVRVRGANLPSLFGNAARALYAALGRWTVQPGAPTVRRVELTGDGPAELLHDWLAELLYRFDADGLCFQEWSFETLEPDRLIAVLRGGRVDPARSDPRGEIKAVTYHQLAVDRQPDGTWRATVIFDV